MAWSRIDEKAEIEMLGKFAFQTSNAKSFWLIKEIDGKTNGGINITASLLPHIACLLIPSEIVCLHLAIVEIFSHDRK